MLGWCLRIQMNIDLDCSSSQVASGSIRKRRKPGARVNESVTLSGKECRTNVFLNSLLVA
jgi:hypothetical protein